MSMIKSIFRKNKYQIIFLTTGAAIGFLYWHYIGCINGCTITSVWYNSTLYGAVLGWLLGGIVADIFKKKQITLKNEE